MTDEQLKQQVKKNVYISDFKIITQNNGFDLMLASHLTMDQKIAYIKETLYFFEDLEEYEVCERINKVLKMFLEK